MAPSMVVIAAETMTVDDLLKSKDLSDSQRSAVADVLRKAEAYKLPVGIQNAEKWQQLGDAFSATIANICKTLNVEVNNFLKTDVGLLVAGVIVYKMIGKDILRIFIYTAVAMTFTLVFGLSLFVFHKKKKVVKTSTDSDKNVTKSIEYIDRFGWEDDVVRNISFIIHIIVWCLVMWIITYNII